MTQLQTGDRVTIRDTYRAPHETPGRVYVIREWNGDRGYITAEIDLAEAMTSGTIAPQECVSDYMIEPATTQEPRQ